MKTRVVYKYAEHSTLFPVEWLNSVYFLVLQENKFVQHFSCIFALLLYFAAIFFRSLLNAVMLPCFSAKMVPWVRKNTYEVSEMQAMAGG